MIYINTVTFVTKKVLAGIHVPKFIAQNLGHFFSSCTFGQVPLEILIKKQKQLPDLVPAFLVECWWSDLEPENQGVFICVEITLAGQQVQTEKP